MQMLLILISILFISTSAFATEITEKEANSFMVDWFEAQNTGTYKKYAAMYSAHFIGIRRSGTKVQKFDHDSWLKDRKAMFSKPMIVSVGIFKIELSGKTALVKFKQTWTSSTYSDEGDKLLHLVLEKGELKIIREEMIFSKVIPISDLEESEIITLTTGTTRDRYAGIVTKYSSIKFSDCWYPKGFNEYTHECPAPRGWRLFHVADEERSWLEIAKRQRLWSTQNEVNGSGDNSFGEMQDLGDFSRMEWRVKPDGTPLSLIFKVQAVEPLKIRPQASTKDTVRLLFRFYAIDLSKDVPLFCGSFKTIELARAKVKDPAGCQDLEEQRMVK